MSTGGNIQATIDGDIGGQVAVGNYILQIGDVNGGVVNVAPQTQAPNYTRRAGPVNLRPRPFPTLLDRDNETASVKSALQAFTPVSLYGPAGIGKTSMLRSLAHAPEWASFPDGVVYLAVSGLGLEDLLQSLFDAFHESQSSFKPTDTEMRVALQGIKALILLDDLSLSRDEITALMDAAPGCTFVLASLERSIWGEGKIVSLSGLPIQEAVDLFVLELNRSLNDQEQAQVREICASLDGHPLRVLQSASLVREKTKTISALRSELQGDASDAALVRNSLNTLTESQQRMLAILAAGDGAVIPESHLGTLSKSPDVFKELQGLISLGLVQAHSPRYSLTGSLPDSLASLWDLSSWEDVLINYLVEWLAQKPGQMLIEESTDVLVSSIKKAGEKKRWPEVIRLGRALERFLILWKRWQTWLDILNLILKAARALGDRKAEAWALHQIGTRAACLGINESARGFLTQALQIRQAIGDQAGLALTQNNLHVFFKIPLPTNTGQSGCRRWLKCGAIGAGGAFVFGAVVVGALISFWRDPEPPPDVVTEEVFVSATPIPAIETDTPTPTFTPTATDIPTITATPMSKIEIHVESLTSLERVMLYQGLKQDFFQVPVDIAITNQSEINVSDLVLTFYFEAQDGRHQTEFMPYEENTYLGDVDISSIGAGKFESVGGYMMVPRSYDGSVVNLMASLDRCDIDLDCEYSFGTVSLPEIVYDFIDNAPSATWRGYDPNIEENYSLIFNGPSPDPAQGTVGLASNQVLEDGSRPSIVLSTHPTWVPKGVVEGIVWPDSESVAIKPGDRFVARVGFIKGGGGDGVTFHLGCQRRSDDVDFQKILTLPDTSNGGTIDIVVPLGEISSDCTIFDLWVDAGPSSTQDYAAWVVAYIERP